MNIIQQCYYYMEIYYIAIITPIASRIYCIECDACAWRDIPRNIEMSSWVTDGIRERDVLEEIVWWKMLPRADSIDVFEKLSSAKKNEIHAQKSWMKNILTEYHRFNKRILWVLLDREHRPRSMQAYRILYIIAVISLIKPSCTM